MYSREESTKIALVICTYNRDKYLSETLESVGKQNLENDKFQLIIVNNNSTDNTSNISQDFISKNPLLNIKYCFEEHKGLSFARNRGVAEATASIISYVDDDVILPSSFLQEMVNFFDKYKDAVGAGGKVI